MERFRSMTPVSFQRDIKGNEIESAFVRLGERLDERHPDRVPTSLLVAPGASVVDEHPPHQPRTHRQEVSPVTPLNPACVNETQVGHIDQRGGLEAVPQPLTPHAAPRDAVEFALDDRNQVLERLLVASPPRVE